MGDRLKISGDTLSVVASNCASVSSLTSSLVREPEEIEREVSTRQLLRRLGFISNEQPRAEGSTGN